ncbi:MAG: cation diffusion facilitator family transporter [Bacteroidota bacterium]
MGNHTHSGYEKVNYNFQKSIVVFGLVLFVVKIFAWYLTGSVAIYSDALESIVNIIAGFLGLFSLYLVSQPKDENHPYGHGKVEFITSGIEGILIAITGIIILVEAIQNLFQKTELEKIDYGIYLVAFTALVNFILGYYAVQKGNKTHSPVLKSTGKHLITDTYSTLGIIVGLILIYFTHIYWIDGAVAIAFSFLILYTAYQIIRDSISGIMDEADQKLIHEFIEFIQKSRIPTWIDLHNLRIIKYGSKLHADLHMTLPYYITVLEAHEEMEKLDKLVNSHFSDRVELFVHTDPCQDFSCQICSLKDCKVRQFSQEKIIQWTFENVSSNRKHRIE